MIFARSEGILPAPESSHAIHWRSSKRSARTRRESKDHPFQFERTRFLRSHRYDDYLNGRLKDLEYPKEKVAEALHRLPKVGDSVPGCSASRSAGDRPEDAVYAVACGRRRSGSTSSRVRRGSSCGLCPGDRGGGGGSGGGRRRVRERGPGDDRRGVRAARDPPGSASRDEPPGDASRIPLWRMRQYTPITPRSFRRSSRTRARHSCSTPAARAPTADGSGTGMGGTRERFPG